jgi:RHS repeat-associated protein
MPMAVRYTTVDGQVLCENRGGVKTLFMPDTLGNVIETRNMDTGAQTSSTTYWPYGEVRTQTGTNPSPFGFCGVWGYYTQAGQPTYVRARYYRPNLGRWQTVDPLWPWESAYGYAGCIPLQFIDFTGAQLAPIGIGGALGAAPKITPLPRALPGGWRIVPGGGGQSGQPGNLPRLGPIGNPGPGPGPFFIPPRTIDERRRRQMDCDEIQYWYHRVCTKPNHKLQPGLPNVYDAQYGPCQEECDGLIFLWIKTVHHCECCRLRELWHRQCGPDNKKHADQRAVACELCEDCLGIMRRRLPQEEAPVRTLPIDPWTIV